MSVSCSVFDSIPSFRCFNGWIVVVVSIDPPRQVLALLWLRLTMYLLPKEIADINNALYPHQHDESLDEGQGWDKVGWGGCSFRRQSTQAWIEEDMGDKVWNQQPAGGAAVDGVRVTVRELLALFRIHTSEHLNLLCSRRQPFVGGIARPPLA